jgi:hypothetical protein
MLYEDAAEMVEYVVQASSTLLALRPPSLLAHILAMVTIAASCPGGMIMFY